MMTLNQLLKLILIVLMKDIIKGAILLYLFMDFKGVQLI